METEHKILYYIQNTIYGFTDAEQVFIKTKKF